MMYAVAVEVSFVKCSYVYDICFKLYYPNQKVKLQMKYTLELLTKFTHRIIQNKVANCSHTNILALYYRIQ